MSYGFEIFNEELLLVSSSDGVVFKELESGSDIVNGITSVYLTEPTDRDILVFFQPPSTGYCAIVNYIFGNGNYEGFTLSSNTSMTINWKVFVTTDIDNGGDIGIAVYDTNGNTTFNSSNKPISIAAFDLYGLGNGDTIEVPDSSNYITSTNFGTRKMTFTIYGGGYEEVVIEVCGFKVNSTTELKLGFVPQYTENNGGSKTGGYSTGGSSTQNYMYILMIV